MLEGNAPDGSILGGTVRQVLRQARDTEEAHRQSAYTPFKPVRLLVYMSNKCNARCIYCFAENEAGRGDEKAAIVSPNAVRAAAELIAPNCSEAGLPLQLIVNGGGEPSLHRELVERIVADTRSVAEAHGLPWRGFMATNGLAAPAKMQRLATLFDEFGLSCDGPPDIQERQRPAKKPGFSSKAVKQTAMLLHDLGKTFSVRTTITRADCERQLEIALYLIGELEASRLRFEPVYRAGLEMAFTPEDAPWFFSNFIQAQQAAQQLGATIESSGVRLDVLHGPYCNIGNQTLHLLPDNTFTACFFAVNGKSDENKTVRLGMWNATHQALHIDEALLANLQKKHFSFPEQCGSCLARFHCSRDCPDLCYLREQDEKQRQAGFRCRLNRLLTKHMVGELIDSIDSPESLPEASELESAEARILLEESKRLEDARPFDLLRDLFQALRLYPFENHHMPQPIWRRRGFDDSGLQTRQTLTRMLVKPAQSPISVYVHIPFCESRCPFCDCHATVVSAQTSDSMRRYTDSLIREIEEWGELAGIVQRPVTTVHFGGGTPQHLPFSFLERVLECLKRHLNIHSETEWAIETTGRHLDAEGLSQLKTLGFTRIHVGVQSMEDTLRRILGRKEPAAVIAERVHNTVELGMIVSVDLLYGLPGQHADDLCGNIEKLMQSGVHGFSLYHLNPSTKNNTFMRKYGLAERSQAQLLSDYMSFQVGRNLLMRHAYSPVFFNHFARSEDRYLYYLCGARGEDLLALGASADGHFQNYFYRNHEFKGYLNETNYLHGGVELHSDGAFRETLTGQLMRGALDKDLLNDAENNIDILIEQWRQHGFLAFESKTGRLALTGAGAWFLDAMLNAFDALSKGERVRERIGKKFP